MSCLASATPWLLRTAEYVRALNLSGNAFRNLDLAALNVLSNHDSAMAEQLLRIQAVLPCSLALESPIQEQDRAFLTANESLSPIGHSPKNVDPSISSSLQRVFRCIRLLLRRRHQST
ncbi:hypothetical protein B0H14DRAFT_264905 [Mycena olivaceomarginata]|nr:hypothetical protein B0H14DRAFT_264905 [Mycena olivaceomarginata]